MNPNSRCKYHYIIEQAGEENKESHQLEIES